MVADVSSFLKLRGFMLVLDIFVSLLDVPILMYDIKCF